MSLPLLKAGLNGRTVQNIMPGRWPTEFLTSWCREIAKHDDGIHQQSETDELFDVLNSYIEKLLLAQDVERLNHFRKNGDTLFQVLARELDEIVRNELVFRIINYNTDRITLRDLFRDHFPAGLGLVAPVHEIDQSHATAAHPGLTQSEVRFP